MTRCFDLNSFKKQNKGRLKYKKERNFFLIKSKSQKVALYSLLINDISKKKKIHCLVFILAFIIDNVSY
jgi:hypothetical protein